jgi:hypothetical protein
MNNVRTLLNEVNGMIETTLLLTRDDVGKIMSLLKKIDGVEAYRGIVSDIVRNLQCFDIFEQRLKHIIEINYSVPLPGSDAGEKATDSDVNIFRLNQLQYEAAWADYIQAISLMKYVVDPHTTQLPFHVDFASDGALTRAAMHLTSDKFEKVVALTHEWQPARLAHYQPSLEEVYSTEVERKLLSMLSANPVLTMQEIKTVLAATQNDDSSIDLF